MLGFVGSQSPFHDLQAGPFVHQEWALQSRQQIVGQLMPRISCRKKGYHLTTTAQWNTENIAGSGHSFANKVTQIFGHRSVNSNTEKLPVYFQNDGQHFQYASDGNALYTVPVHTTSEQQTSQPRTNWQAHKQVKIVVERFERAIYKTFVPDPVRPHYLVYMKWKFLHRFCSSVLQVQCTQAMLQAIGIGARRSLPAAAGLTWVLKDGLGRLGRFAFSGYLGSTFDSGLKKVRFSTSVLFSLSLGFEMLTPMFPDCFLLLATLANVGKSIALSAYLATTSAIHRSFAVGENLADIAAKGQVQTVVADNLGLAVAVALGSLTRINKKFDSIWMLAFFPFLVGLDLYAIYHELQSIHLQTLNKARLEIIIDGWLHTGQVRSAQEVSEVECRQFIKMTDKIHLPLRIGALNPKGRNPNDVMQAFNYQRGQPYAFFEESQGFLSFLYQPQLLLWLRKGFTARQVITAVLQAGFVRSMTTSKAEPPSIGEEELQMSIPRAQAEAQDQQSNVHLEDKDRASRYWQFIIVESRKKAEASVDDLIAAMEKSGWQIDYILLDPKERQTYSTTLAL